MHFRIDKTVNYAWVKTVSYYIYLDEDLYNQLNQTIITNNDVIIDKTIDLRIENVSQGKHTINVDVDIEYCPSSWIPLYQPAHVSSSLGLFVYKGIIPEISISDLDTHLTNQTTFRITTNLFDSTVSYSLDGSSNFTLPQNESSSLQNSYFYSVTVLGLSTGHHNITAYMKDALNHTAKAEETFTIGQPVPTLTIVAVVGAAIIAIASTVILLYRKSKNKTTSKT